MTQMTGHVCWRVLLAALLVAGLAVATVAAQDTSVIVEDVSAGEDAAGDEAGDEAPTVGAKGNVAPPGGPQPPLSASKPEGLWRHTDDYTPKMSELKKISQFTYGHLVLDGGVSHYEFFRASFGGAIPCGVHRMAMADPQDACGPLVNAAAVAGAFVLTTRGNCTFVNKALAIQAAGGAGMLVANNEPGMFRMPAGPQSTANISIPVVMLSATSASVVNHTLSLGLALSASLVPTPEPCLPPEFMSQFANSDRPLTATDLDLALDRSQQLKASEARLAASGEITSVDGTELAVEFFTSEFGGPVTARNFFIQPAVPSLACGPLENEAELKGKFAVIERGECPMVDKVRYAVNAGAHGVILVNNEPMGVIRAVGDAHSQNIAIPVLMISQPSWQILQQMQDKELHMIATLAPDDAWAQLVLLRQSPSSFLGNVDNRKQVLLDFLQANHPKSPQGSAERYTALQTILEEAGFLGDLRDLEGQLSEDQFHKQTQTPQGPTINSETRLLMRTLLKRPHRVLDNDAGAATRGYLKCNLAGNRYVFDAPQSGALSTLTTQKHLERNLRSFACLERLALNYAIAMGQQLRLLRSKLTSEQVKSLIGGLSQTLDLELSEETISLLIELARKESARSKLDDFITLQQWLDMDAPGDKVVEMSPEEAEWAAWSGFN